MSMSSRQPFRRTGAHQHAGFTLIEVLVALIIFSSVIGIVMAGLDQGRMLWQRAFDQADEQKMLTQRHQWLQQMFDQAVMSNFQIGYGVATPYFIGTPDTVRMITNAPIIGGPGTYATVELTITQQQQATLAFTQWPNKDPYYGIPSYRETNNQLTVLTGLQDVEWQYFLPPRRQPSSNEISQGSFTPRLEGQWGDEFDALDERRLPPQIKLSFAYRNERYEWFFTLPTGNNAADINQKVQVY